MNIRLLLEILLAAVCSAASRGSSERATQMLRKYAEKFVESYLSIDAPNSVEGFNQMIDNIVKSERPDWHFTLFAGQLRYSMTSRVEELALKLLDVPNLFLLEEVPGLVEPAQVQTNLANELRGISQVGLHPDHQTSYLFDSPDAVNKAVSRRLLGKLVTLVEDKMPGLFTEKKDGPADDWDSEAPGTVSYMIKGLLNRLVKVRRNEYMLPLEVIVDLTFFKDTILFISNLSQGGGGFLTLFSDAIDICLESAGDGKRMIPEFAVISGQLETLFLGELDIDPQFGQMILSKRSSMKSLLISVEQEAEALTCLVPMILEYLDLGGVSTTALVEVSVRVINNPQKYSRTALARWMRSTTMKLRSEPSLCKPRVDDETLSLAVMLAKFYGIDFLNEYSTSVLPHWKPAKKHAVGVLLQAAIRDENFAGMFHIEDDLAYKVDEKKLIKAAGVVSAIERLNLGSRSAPLVSSPWDWAARYMGLTPLRSDFFANLLADRFDVGSLDYLPRKIGNIMDLRRLIEEYLIGFPTHLVKL